MILKRIGPVSLAKISGTLYAFLGVILGGILALISILGLATHPPGAPAAFGLLFGVGAVIWAPLFYGGIGFVGALIMAGLYNWLARVVGGVHLELE